MPAPTDRSTSAFSPRLDNVIFAVALAAAAITRLTYLDLAEFKDDEARALGIAAAFLEGKLIPLIGIVSSVGINNPPAFEYLLTIPLLLSRNPAVATGFIGLLGVGAVFFTYRVCDCYFDRTTARVAALLFASAPWAIIFSRKLQAQDVVPFFVILWIGSLFAFASGRGSRHLIGVALWLNLLLQLHLASVALIPITGIVVAIAAWRQRGDTRLWRSAAEALGLTMVLWLPFAIFQLTHGLADLHAFLKVMRQPPTIELESFKLVYEMVYLNAYSGVTGLGYPLYHAQTIDFGPVYDAERWLFMSAIVWLVARLAISRGRAPTDWRDGILLLWLVIPPLAFVRHATPIYPHYFLTVFPAQFIIIGRLFSGVAGMVAGRRRFAQTASLVGALVVAVFVVTQVAGLLSVMDFVGRESTLGGHGVPLRERQAAMDRAVVASNGSRKPVYVASNGNDYPSSFEYLADNRISLKVFDDTDTFVVPADDGAPTIYLTTDPTPPSAKLLQQRFADRQIGVVPWPGLTTGFTLYRLPPDAGTLLLHPPSLRPIDGTLPNGLHLTGYEIDRQVKAGDTTQLALYWQVTGDPPIGEDYAFFSHLIDANGHVWGQQDGLGYPPYFWQRGDSVVSLFDLAVGNDVPAGVGRIETGMYRRSDTGRLPIRLADGTTVDRLLLGPLRLVPAVVPPVPTPSHPTLVHFGPSIDLVGVDNDWLTTPASGNRTFHVTLTWKVNATPDADYTTFVHFVDAAGNIVAQSDGQPGPYPTTLWVAGDTIQDVRTLTLTGPIEAGNYQLVGGLYRADTMARLASDQGDEVNFGGFGVQP